MTLGLHDNGSHLNVTALSCAQIANLVIDSLSHDNCHWTTLAAMNVSIDSPWALPLALTALYAPLLDVMQPDSCPFLDSLLNGTDMQGEKARRNSEDSIDIDMVQRCQKKKSINNNQPTTNSKPGSDR